MGSFADSPTSRVLKLAGITALALLGLRAYDKWSTANEYCNHHARINSAIQFTLSGPKGSERHIATFRGAAILSGTELLARPVPEASWEWIIWTDAENRALVKKFFPWYLVTYDGFEGEIHRADAASYMKLFIFGGMTPDLDMECLRPFDRLLAKTLVEASSTTSTLTFDDSHLLPTLHAHLILGAMGKGISQIDGPHGIPNAWMAASPHHPFFIFMMGEMESSTKSDKEVDHPGRTGSAALHRALHAYRSTYKEGTLLVHALVSNTSPSSALLRQIALSHSLIHDITVLPPRDIFPYNWHHPVPACEAMADSTIRHFDPELCKEELGVDDVRGSFQRSASSGLDNLGDLVREASTRGRMAVGIGQARGIFNGAAPPPARRQLAATQSMPALSFAPSSREVNESVFNSGGAVRDHELRPFWADGSPSTSSRQASGVFTVASDGFRTRAEDTEESGMETGVGMEDGGDGFDVDEVFAPSGADFTSRALTFDAFDGDGDAPESQTSSGTAATITSRLKRTHADDEPETPDDYEMVDTEDEDEVDDIIPAALNAPIGRVLAGRRSLSKTQSLPASVFSTVLF
ncbi:hypothetical protein RQP46_009629 [Phenoliferia psychrophenolica]